MFKAKQPSLQGRTNILGDKDRKVLRNQFLSQFPSKDRETFNDLFPPTAQASVFAIKGGCEIYICNETPWFFVLSKKKGAPLYPTLFTLWQLPDLLPLIVCQVQAPKYLIRGADLMLPGCIQPPNGYAETEMDLDQIWAVRCIGNPMPLAVGQILMNKSEIQQADKGKILQVHHVVGDLLMKLGPGKETYPEGFTVNTCEPLSDNKEISAQAPTDGWDMDDTPINDEESETQGNEDDTGAVDPEESKHNVTEATTNEEPEVSNEPIAEPPARADKGGTSSSGPDVKLPTAAVDLVIELVLIDVLKRQVIAHPLPVEVSTLWGNVSQCIPEVVMKCEDRVKEYLESKGVAIGEYIHRDATSEDEDEDRDDGEAGAAKGWTVAQLCKADMKKSSWRTAKKFANHYKKMKLWTLKENRGQVHIVKINTSHSLMSKHVPLPIELTKASAPSDSKERQGKSSSSKSDKHHHHHHQHNDDEHGSPQDDHASSNGPKKLFPLTAYEATASSREILTIGKAFEHKTSTSSALTAAEVTNAFSVYMKHLMALTGNKSDLYPPLDTHDESKQVAMEPGNTLPWYKLIVRDANLMNICFTKSERQAVKAGGDPPEIKDSVLLQRFMSNGVKVITFLLNRESDAQGAMDDPQSYGVIEADAKITVSTVKAKRFTRTRVAGIHNFSMIEPKSLAEKLQKACAASASVCELEELKGKSKPLGVVVQGSVVREVCQVLHTVYGLPKNMIAAND